MSSRRKYENFVESEPYEKSAKCPPYTPRKYIGVTCPHCTSSFVEIAVDSLKANRSARIRTHLLKCPAYECPPCEEGAFPPKSSVLVVHDKCIMERETLQEEKSSLEQKLDKMSDQLTEQRQEMTQQRQEMKQHTESIIQHADKRWSSFAHVMVNKFPSLKQPVNDETIPVQMQQHEQTLLLKDRSKRETMRLRIKELELINSGLVDQQGILNDRFKVAIRERNERVEMAQYKRLMGKHDKLGDEVANLRDELVEVQDVVQKFEAEKQRKRKRHTSTSTENL